MRWLSRDRGGVVRITGTPLAVRVTDMPPRPPEGRPPSEDDIWGIGAATVVNPDPAHDPCGAPPISPGKSRRRT